MKLTILGGGGFRVPLVYGALLGDHGQGRVTHVTLYDLDEGRLSAIARVLVEQGEGVPDAPVVTATTDLDEALRGADFVFSAIRVGGLEGRAADERIALAEGVLGQETVGAGGIAYGLRTVPVAEHIARRVAELAPDAWVINFTNPAGLVTEAMSRILGDRVVGICDSPVGLGRRVARVLGADPDEAWIDYVGLNHLGWLRGLRIGGRDELPGSSPTRRRSGPSRRAGCSARSGCARSAPSPTSTCTTTTSTARPCTRTGPPRAPAAPTFATNRPVSTRRWASPKRPPWTPGTGRSPTARRPTWPPTVRPLGIGERAEEDLESGGYEKVALALMRAVARDERATLILNVRNGSTLAALDADAVIEVPCLVDANGAHPVSVAPLPYHAVGLVTAVKAVEREVLAAVESGSRATAVKAFALHPLVDSVSVARRLVENYTAEHAGLAYLRH